MDLILDAVDSTLCYKVRVRARNFRHFYSGVQHRDMLFHYFSNNLGFLFLFNIYLAECCEKKYNMTFYNFFKWWCCTGNTCTEEFVAIGSCDLSGMSLLPQQITHTHFRLVYRTSLKCFFSKETFTVARVLSCVYNLDVQENLNLCRKFGDISIWINISLYFRKHTIGINGIIYKSIT